MPKQTEMSHADFLSQPFLVGGQKYAFAMARFQGQAFKSMMRYQVEALSFLRHRYEQDMKLVDDLIGSDDFNDAFDIYASFLQNAVSEYTAETCRMAGITSKIASDTAARVKREADAAVEDMAASTTTA
jgi:hypothetical protein